MNVLTFESTNKLHKKIKTISFYEAEKILETDNGLIEVINMRDPTRFVRIYFDIDESDTTSDPLNKAISMLCDRFQCNRQNWAIATANRNTKLSYHIVSKISSIRISDLRRITLDLEREFPVFDSKILFFGIDDPYESGYFRLPNQSKHVINKVGLPFRIIEGELKDFFVTDVSDLSPI